jgi:uncharacterized phage-like protein YoqJ
MLRNAIMCLQEDGLMRVAIIGSRKLKADISKYVPEGCTVIISGGASGIDKYAAGFAKEKGLELVEYLPDYKRYGRAAPIKRNNNIIDNADVVVAIWDGKSKGTKYVIERCRKLGKLLTLHMLEDEENVD